MTTATAEKKNKRVRKVWDTDQVAHLWANQSQDEARNKHGNFYFTGDTIYSYGGHFPIARHVTKGKGKRARKYVLFTTRTYSKTTANHIYLTRLSLRNHDDKTVIKCMNPGVYSDHGPNLAWYDAEIKENLDKSRTARNNKLYYLSTAKDLAEQANKYCKLFGIKRKFKVIEIPQEVIDQHHKLMAKQAEKDREKLEKWELERRERNRISQEKFSEQSAQWMRGELRTYDLAARHINPVMLRLVRNDAGEPDMVETSHGAFVPYKDAVRLLGLVRSGYTIGQVTNRVIGGFPLRKITAESVEIGCHTIPVKEIERLAATLGL